jgi:histidine ammonia-lyase
LARAGSVRPLKGTARSGRGCTPVLAVEWVAAARGIELRAPLQPAAGTAAAVGLLRTRVPGPGPDRWLSPELAAAEQMLTGEALVPAAEAVTGPLA